MSDGISNKCVFHDIRMHFSHCPPKMNQPEFVELLILRQLVSAALEFEEARMLSNLIPGR